MAAGDGREEILVIQHAGSTTRFRADTKKDNVDFLARIDIDVRTTQNLTAPT